MQHLLILQKHLKRPTCVCSLRLEQRPLALAGALALLALLTASPPLGACRLSYSRWLGGLAADTLQPLHMRLARAACRGRRKRPTTSATGWWC